MLGLVNELGDTDYPPTQWEKDLIADADRLGLSFDIFTRPGFWTKPPEERRRLFRDIENVMDDVRHFMEEDSHA